MELRFAGGTDFGLGPALAWLRLARPLVDDEPVSPVARVAAAADFTNGVSRVLDFRDHLFVNTELSVHLHREPAGEWVLLDARTHLERTGAGLAEARLFDAARADRRRGAGALRRPPLSGGALAVRRRRADDEDGEVVAQRAPGALLGQPDDVPGDGRRDLAVQRRELLGELGRQQRPAGGRPP